MTTVLCSLGQKSVSLMQFLQLCLLRSKSSAKSSSGQKVPRQKSRSKSSSPFSIAEWGFEGCPLLTVVSIPWAILALFYTPLYTFLPFSSWCYFVACDFLVVLDCFCFFSQARSVSNFGPKGKCRRSFRAYWQTTRPPSLFLPKKISGSKGCARFLFVQPTFLRLIPACQ